MLTVNAERRAPTRCCLLIALAVLLFAVPASAGGDYSKDMDEPANALNKASWLSKDQYESYAKAFNEYEKERNDSLTGLVKCVGLPDKDISSAWRTTHLLGSVVLAHIKDIPSPTLEKLGLKTWVDRETLMWEKLKAEQFLRARADLISIKDASVQAANMLDEKWKGFDQANQAINSALVELDERFKDKLTLYGEFAGKLAKLINQAFQPGGTLGGFLTAINEFGGMSKQLRPAIEAVHLKMQSKQANWEGLKQLSTLQEQIWEQIDPKKIEAKFSEGKFDDVSGSEDYKKFTSAAIEALKLHRQAALAADDAYRKVVENKFSNRSQSTIENIKQLDTLGRKWKEFEDIEKSAEDSLKNIEEKVDKEMRDGPEKNEATSGLKETHENLRQAEDEQKKALEEYKSEAEKVKD